MTCQIYIIAKIQDHHIPATDRKSGQNSTEETHSNQHDDEGREFILQASNQDGLALGRSEQSEHIFPLWSEIALLVYSQWTLKHGHSEVWEFITDLFIIMKKQDMVP